jgi:hypothetical protein
MADEEKSFEELLKAAPGGGTVSLVGTLAQSSEPGKFVLTLQDGKTMTLATASVKGHAVLGTSVGQTIVRVDVDAGSLPSGALGAPFTVADIYTPPGPDYKLAWRDHHPKPVMDPPKPPWVDPKMPWMDPVDPIPFGGAPTQGGGVVPFSLATPHQAPASTLAAMQGLGNPAFGGGGWWSGYYDNPIWSGWLDNPKLAQDGAAKIMNDSGATGGPRWD